MAMPVQQGTYRVFGEHSADACELSDLPQECQEGHGSKPVEVVHNLNLTYGYSVAAAGYHRPTATQYPL